MRNRIDIDLDTISPIYRAFASLPRLRDIPPRPEATSNRIALIPIFSDSYTRIEDLPALVQSAIYSRASCLKNTDAIAEGVPVKIYIEDYIGNRFARQLMRNGVDPDRDALYFDSTEQPYWNYMAKKTICYHDPELEHYEQVLVWDADMYFPPTPINETLFAKLDTLNKRSVHYVRLQQMLPDWKVYWENNLKLDDLTPDDILETLGLDTENLVGIDRPVGQVYVIPSEYLHQSEKHMIDWIEDNAYKIGCDEVTISLAHHKFNPKLLSLQHYDIHAQSIAEYFQHAHEKVAFIHMSITYGTDQACMDFIRSII